jgi:hypothetical protein
MTASNTSRNERRDQLDKLVSQRALTDAGARWVRKALDPFHDFSVRVDGMPDSNTSPTVVQEYNVTSTFSVPAGVTGNWDAHIFNLPDLASYAQSYTSFLQYPVTTSGSEAVGQYNFVYGGTATIANGLGTINVSSGPAGFRSLPDDSATSQSQYATFSNIPLPVGSQPGNRRCIYLAFEITDTTAELYQQGTVTAYEMPQDVTLGTYNTGSGAGPNVLSQYVVSRSPPALNTQAMLLYDSRQWASKYGAYVVCKMDTDSEWNKLRTSVSGQRLYTNDDLAGWNFGTPGSTYGFGTFSSPTIAGTGATTSITQHQFSHHPIMFNTSGIFLTGLNQNSTFTVTVRYGIEYAPSPYETQLVSLAQPSPHYDPAALEIYKRAAVELPIAVPVGENESGDFWDTVLGIIGDVAPMVGSMIPIPGAGMLGNLVGSGAKMGQSARNKPKAQKQASSSRPPDTRAFQAQNDTPASRRALPSSGRPALKKL